MALTGISANRLELLQIAEAVAREKAIDKEIVIDAIEDAITKGARARYGAEHDIRAKIELDRVADNRKRFKGVLAGIEGDQVLVDLEGEADTTAQIPFAWVSDAKLTLSDELLKRGAAARAARLEADSLEAESPDQPDAEEDA